MVSLPMRALRVVETLGARLSKGLICRFLDLIDPSLIPVAQYMISFSLQMQEYPIAAKRRKGCSPLLRQSRHIGARGNLPVRRQALGRAHTPVRVYKCALCSKGIILRFRPRLVFSKNPVLARSSGQAGKRSAHPRPAWQ